MKTIMTILAVALFLNSKALASIDPTGIAFFDAYLRGLPEALAWLNSNGMSTWSNGVATITTK